MPRILWSDLASWRLVGFGGSYLFRQLSEVAVVPEWPTVGRKNQRVEFHQGFEPVSGLRVERGEERRRICVGADDGFALFYELLAVFLREFAEDVPLNLHGNFAPGNKSSKKLLVIKLNKNVPGGNHLEEAQISVESALYLTKPYRAAARKLDVI